MSIRLSAIMVVLLAGLPALAEKPAWQRLLQGTDAPRAEMLQEKVDTLQEAGKFAEALKPAEELARLRQERQGDDHWETVNARFIVAALRRALDASKEDQEAYAASFALRKRADALDQQGRYKDALPLREQIRAIDSKLLGEDHPDTARSYSNLALEFNRLGRVKEAAEGVQKALAIRRKALGEKHPLTAASYNSVAVTLNAQARHREAEAAGQKALAIRLEVLGEEDLDTATSYNNVAFTMAYLGRYREAEEGYRKALAIRRKLVDEDDPVIAHSYSNVAANLADQGRYREAEEGLQKVLDIRRRVLGEEHPDTARSYNNLAFILRAQGRYREAEAGFAKALAIWRKRFGDEHHETATTYNNIAYNRAHEGRYKEAEEGYQKALEIRRKVFGEEHPATARSYHNLALNYDDLGKHTEAEANFRKALAINRKMLGDEHPDTAYSEDGIAGCLTVQGRYEEAEEPCKKALAIRRKVLGEEHPTTVRNYSHLARILNARGRYREAEEQYGRAADGFLTARLHIAASGLGRAAETSEQSPLFHFAALLARNGKPALAWDRLEQGLGRGAWDDLSARLRRPAKELAQQTELVTQLERLDQLLAQYSTLRKPTADQERQRDALLERRREAQEQLTAFQHHLEETYGPAEGQVFDRSTIQAALPVDAALVAWIDIDAGAKAADPNGEHWAVLLRSQGEPIFERLRGSGPGGDWTAEDTALPQRLRTALQSSRRQWRELARQVREQRLQPLRKHLAAADKLPAVRHLIVLPSAALAGVPLEAVSQEYTISHASSGTLYAHLRKQPAVKSTSLLALGDPVFDATAAKERPLPPGGVLLTVVQPDSGAAKARLRPGDVLLKYGDTHLKTVADLETAMAAADAKADIPVQVWREGTTFERQVQPGTLGVVLASKPAREALAERYRLDRVLASRSGDDGWAQLPGTRVEVEALHRLFGDSSEPRLLFDSDASEQRLDALAGSGELGKYRYLHLATHGEVDGFFPLRSAVILARDTLPDPQKQLLAGKPIYDGRLTAEEMLRTWNLHSDLVTLSACETALGKYERGEGFVGFAQALILCGSRSVCLSLWKVDDSATALLMQRFYANLLGKRDGLKGPMTKAAALREAKEWLRNLSRTEALKVAAQVSQGVERGKGRPRQKLLPPVPEPAPAAKDDRPYAHPYYWAAFVLIGDPD
jgi:tetratricopeptide (TPR) repeat protein